MLTIIVFYYLGSMETATSRFFKHVQNEFKFQGDSENGWLTSTHTHTSRRIHFEWDALHHTRYFPQSIDNTGIHDVNLNHIFSPILHQTSHSNPSRSKSGYLCDLALGQVKTKEHFELLQRLL
jgi:hypothetical protein